MRLRCTTDYFMQLDEDMELYENAIDVIYSEIILNKNITQKNTFLNLFRLRDDYLGIQEKKWIYGVKLYNNNIMKSFPTMNNGKTSTSAVDRCWHTKIKEAGYKIRRRTIILGNHEKH